MGQFVHVEPIMLKEICTGLSQQPTFPRRGNHFENHGIMCQQAATRQYRMNDTPSAMTPIVDNMK